MVECVGCGTKQNISPDLFGFWICEKCLLKRTIRLYEDFIKRKIWKATRETEQDYHRTLKNLKKRLDAQLGDKEK